MDVIIPDDEETMVETTKNHKSPDNNDDDGDADDRMTTGSAVGVENDTNNDYCGTNVCINYYEYEDPTSNENINNELRNSNNNNNNNSSRRSDNMNQHSENSLNASRRRINVIASSTSEHGNHNYGNRNNNSGSSGSSSTNKTLASSSRGNVVYNPTQRIVLYSPPRQRQKWGDTQILPLVNWFDLFFDLFYVGATYNVSTILYNAPTVRGLLYAAGTFLPVMNIWMERTHYEARYVMDDDVFHRLLLILAFTVVGITISNIRTVDILSDPTNSSSIFFFTAMLVVERVFSSGLYLEIYLYGVGQPQMKHAAKRDCIYSNFSLPFYFAAMIIAATKYFGGGGASTMDENGRFMVETSTTTSTNYDSSSSDGRTDIPIALCLIGCIIKTLSFATMIIFCLPKDGRHKEFAVPLNVDLIIHRNGEWMMLMLGESIFSLLIVDVPNKSRDFYLVFYFSLLTVILLQLLHFQSQPHEADLHAVRRSKNRGMLWSLLQSLYSLALLIMGASYTFFLLYANDSDESRRRLASVGAVDESDRVGAAHLYSGALAIVLLCLLVMNLLHENSELIQLQCWMKSRNYASTFVWVLRIGTIVLAATISQWTYTPNTITMTGLICVIADLLLRKLESINVKDYETTITKTTRHEDEEKQDQVDIMHAESEEASWPNVMHPGAAVEDK